MKPSTVFFRSCSLTVFLAGAVHSSAGVSVKNPDDSRFFNEERKCKQEEVDAETQYANDKITCDKEFLRSKADGCMQWAQGRYAAAKDKVVIHRNNNNGTHQKAVIDFQRASESKNITGKSPQEKGENLRHFNAETTFKKEEVDANTQYENDKVLCHTQSGHHEYHRYQQHEIYRRHCLHGQGCTQIRGR